MQGENSQEIIGPVLPYRNQGSIRITKVIAIPENAPKTAPFVPAALAEFRSRRRWMLPIL